MLGQYQNVPVRLAQYNYNELGQLSNKKLHRNGAGEFIQSMTFDYNIRGWLLALNGGKLSGTAQNGNLFAFALHYNTLNNSLIANGVRQYNGNIAAQTWISRRDNTARGFTYEYDNLNRLVKSTFVSANATENNNYNTATTYDKNGNINSMYRRGVTQLTTNANGLPDFTYDIMDNMAYSYERTNNSNRLSSVYDYATSQRDLPDFDNGDNDGNTPDYAYDDNGNLIKDLNKKIEKIAYNRLNLPSEVVFTGKGKITYSYNAAGVKLSKTVEEVGKPTKIMTYANGFLYENGELKEFGTAEGRMIFQKTPPSGVRGLFQYHYKDHLGNVRMTFAPDVPQVEGLRLSMEVDSLAKEEKDFSNIELTRTDQEAAEGRSSARLAKNKGSISSRTLRVEKDGKLTLSARATYDNEKVINPIENLPTVAEKTLKTATAAGALLAIQDINIGGETKSKSLNFNILAVVPFIKNLFVKPTKVSQTLVGLRNPQPKGYIEIAVYKDSLLTELLQTKTTQISEKGEYFWENLQDSLTFDTDGFVVVSLRNESEKDVLFDELDLKVYGTEKAVIIQENHYEPFGMTLKGLDYVLNEKYKNQQLFGGKELTEDLGLEGYDFVNRGYDPQKGSFNQIDPLADKMRRYSPYVYCFDNPLRFIDPDGMMPIPPVSIGLMLTKIKLFEMHFLEKRGLNKAEAAVVATNELDAIKVDGAAKEAVNFENELRPASAKRGDGDMFNALKHAYWSARSAQAVGKEEAKKFTDAHEAGQVEPNGEQTAHSKSDLNNNEVGLNIGENNSQAPASKIMQLLLGAAKEGKLSVVTTDSQGNPTVQKVTINKTQQTALYRAIQNQQKLEKEIDEHLRIKKVQKTRNLLVMVLGAVPLTHTGQNL